MTKEPFQRTSFSLTASTVKKLNYIVKIGDYKNQSAALRELIEKEYKRCFDLEEKQLKDEAERIRARQQERRKEAEEIRATEEREELERVGLPF